MSELKDLQTYALYRLPLDLVRYLFSFFPYVDEVKFRRTHRNWNALLDRKFEWKKKENLKVELVQKWLADPAMRFHGILEKFLLFDSRSLVNIPSLTFVRNSYCIHYPKGLVTSHYKMFFLETWEKKDASTQKDYIKAPTILFLKENIPVGFYRSFSGSFYWNEYKSPYICWIPFESLPVGFNKAARFNLHSLVDHGIKSFEVSSSYLLIHSGFLTGHSILFIVKKKNGHLVNILFWKTDDLQSCRINDSWLCMKSKSQILKFCGLLDPKGTILWKKKFHFFIKSYALSETHLYVFLENGTLFQFSLQSLPRKNKFKKIKIKTNKKKSNV